ncbi:MULTISPECIES: invasion associated locus B family protein [unclassified Bartonella]|uniref:invasion associated locus B family protein n=1 Tax=unclassified Bartonella TaxID=2645622 RepID=UPI0015F8C391|nr:MULTISPECIES: invasion associated locus B family protein [unclassified Bartonella]UXN04379.1 invasion associated locus B family protein [Bartonella sp. HY406]UXN07373.1 invasion associated locus B family protein [Bartonella sp. HY761]
MSAFGNFFKSVNKAICAISMTGLLVSLGMAPVIAFAQPASQQDVPQNQNFGSWTKVCSQPSGTPNIQCEITQSARAKDRPDISFRVSFIKRPAKDQGTLLRVIVPIRVELQLGIGIMIDGTTDMGHMPYRRCLGDSCVAEVLLNNTELASFLNGKNATFYVFTTPQDGVGGIINLDGVKAGYNALP